MGEDASKAYIYRQQPSATAAGLVTAHTGMRGLLSLWIVIFHCLLYSIGWNLNGSALMAFFYLLSGYSLAVRYGEAEYGTRAEDNANEPREGGAKFNRRGFYQNRFARIAPVYYLVTLMALPLAFLGHGWEPIRGLWFAVVQNVLAVQTWDGRPGPTIVGPGWTISTLAFFYLVFPWLLKRYQNRSDRSLNRSVTILMVVQAVVFLVLFIGISGIDGDGEWAIWCADAWPLSRTPVFAMGLVAGLLVLRQGLPDRDSNVRMMGVSNDKGNPWAKTVDRRMGILALSIAAFSIFEIVTKIDPGGRLWMGVAFPYLMLPSIVGLSMAGYDRTSVTIRLLNWPPLLFLGKISLALYLVHEPVIQYVAAIARPNQSWIEGLPTPMPVWGTAVVVPVSIVLAVLLERYVEIPAHKYLRSNQHRT